MITLLPSRVIERIRLAEATVTAFELAVRNPDANALLDFWVRELEGLAVPDGLALFILEGYRWIRVLPEDAVGDPKSINESVLEQASGAAEPIRIRALGSREPDFVLARYAARDGWRGVVALWGRRGHHKRRHRLAAEFAAAIGRSMSILRRTDASREQAVASERSHWAAELHDGHLQSLSSSKLHAEVCLALEEAHQEVCLALGPSDAPSRLRSELARLADLLADTIREARQFLLELRSPPTNAAQFLPWLRAYADDFERESSIRVEVRIEGEGELPRSQVQDTTRLIREALTNVRKHSKAGLVRIAIAFSDSGTSISVSDDGVGFDLKGTMERLLDSSHNGLTGSRYRVEAIGGEMRVRSEPGKGTTLFFRLPPGSAAGAPDPRRRTRPEGVRPAVRPTPASLSGPRDSIRATLAEVIGSFGEDSAPSRHDLPAPESPRREPS